MFRDRSKPEVVACISRFCAGIEKGRKNSALLLLIKNGVIPIKIKGIDTAELLSQLKTAEGRKELYKKYRELIMYFIFGVGTTIISFATYYLFRWIFPDAQSVPSWLSWIFNITSMFGAESNTALPVILSWIFSVTFAFVTNRVYVFGSKASGFGKVALEAVKFYASRIFTLLVDLVIMFLLVDLTGIENGLYEFCAKVLSNVVVLVLNFVLSKLLVFRNK